MNTATKHYSFWAITKTDFFFQLTSFFPVTYLYCCLVIFLTAWFNTSRTDNLYKFQNNFLTKIWLEFFFQLYCLLNKKKRRSKKLVQEPGVQKKHFGYRLALSGQSNFKNAREQSRNFQQRFLYRTLGIRYSRVIRLVVD